MHSPLCSPPTIPSILDIPRPSHNAELHGHSPPPLPTPFVSAPSSPRLDLLDNSDFDFSARFSDAGSAGAPSASFMPPMSTADELFLNGKIRPLNGCAAASGVADCSCRWSSDGARAEERKTEMFGGGDSLEERGRGRQAVPATPPFCCCCCRHSYCRDVRQAAMSASRRLHYHHRCEMMMMMMTSMMRANSDVLCNLQLLDHDDDDDDADPCCTMNHHHPRHDHYHRSNCGAGAPQNRMLLRPHDGDGDSKSSNFSSREFRHGYGDEMHRWHQHCGHGHRDDEKKSEDGDGDGDSLLQKKKKKAARIHGQGQKASSPLYAEIKNLAADCRCCPATLGGGAAAAAAARRRRSGCSAPPASHRRTRSLSPLRVFHMDDLVIMAPPRPSFESHLSYASASEWAQTQERCKSKPHRRRTLKEFLSVGGNNRVHECERGRTGGEDTGSYGGKKLLQLRQQQKKGNHNNNRRCTQREEWQGSKCSVGMKNKPSCGHHQNQIQQQQQHHHSHGHASASAAFFSGAHHQYASCQKAQAEILKKRTFLPYKHGLLGCLGFTSKSYSSMKGLPVLP